MSAAKAKKAKKQAKKNTKKPAPRRVIAKAGGSQSMRPFRFTAADTVKIQFASQKPENFRVDDMVEATLATLDGQTKLYFQYRLVGTTSERVLWFFDPKPIDISDPIGPSLWQPVSEQNLEGYAAVAACSGNFSTKSVTSYDGSGSRHIVKVDDKPTYRMQLDLNGQREFCESLSLTIRKGDVLIVRRS